MVPVHCGDCARCARSGKMVQFSQQDRRGIMSSPLMHRVDSCAAAAISEGALVPIDAHEFELESAGLSFRVRLVQALQKKQELPGGPRDPDFNPFLPPEPA